MLQERVFGISLQEWSKDRTIRWQEVTRLTAALADALAYAHATSTIHRDIKPANILITQSRGGEPEPVLIDFGLSINDSNAGEDRGLVSGTPAYMSPEQVLGEAHRVDGRTDIYSLGVVLFQLLCGHVPFQSKSKGELFLQICEDEPQPPRQIVPSIPEELECICLRALSKRVS